jgi:hypothetical protein
MLEFAELDGVPNRFKETAEFPLHHGYSPEIPAAIDQIVSGRVS